MKPQDARWRSETNRPAAYRVRTYRSFEELPADYRRLFEDMGGVSFSFSLPWFRAFASTALQENAELRLYGVESGEAEIRAHGLLVAQTPAARRGSVLRNRHVGRRTLSGLTGYQTYLYAPLLREDDPGYDEILASLARLLRSERPRWELIDFSAMDADERCYGTLAAALHRVGYAVHRYPHFSSIFESTRKLEYADYLERLPQSGRRQLRDYERKERQLQREYSYRVELFRNGKELDQAVSDFASVLEASWKEPDQHPEFLPKCIRAAAQAGALRLMVIYLNDHPTAAQLVFLAGRRAVFYRTAYDPKYAKRSVGGIVKLRMVRHLLGEDRVDELDLGRDREAYKRFFATNERLRRGILAFDCRTLGGLRSLAAQLAFELYDWLGDTSRPARAKLKALRKRDKVV